LIDWLRCVGGCQSRVTCPRGDPRLLVRRGRLQPAALLRALDSHADFAHDVELVVWVGGGGGGGAGQSNGAARKRHLHHRLQDGAFLLFCVFFLSAGPFVRSAFDNALLNGSLRLDMFARLLASFLTYLFTRRRCLQFFDAVGWAAGMASGL